MNDERFQEWQDRIQPRFAYWLGVLGLTDWEWHVDYERENIPLHLTYECDGQTAASINANWAYKSLRVCFHLLTLENMGDELTDQCLDDIIAHELMHAVTDELKAAVPKKRLREYYGHEERVVSHMAGVLARMEHQSNQYIASLQGQLDAARGGQREDDLQEAA